MPKTVRRPCSRSEPIIKGDLGARSPRPTTFPQELTPRTPGTDSPGGLVQSGPREYDRWPGCCPIAKGLTVDTVGSWVRSHHAAGRRLPRRQRPARIEKNTTLGSSSIFAVHAPASSVSVSRSARSLTMSHGSADNGVHDPSPTFYDRGRFGRLFPTLPPFAADTPLIREALAELGAPGGPMDAGDDLSDPVTLITDPAKSAHNPNNPTLHGGVHVPGPVPRSRHDLRPDVEPGPPAGSGVDPQLPHPGARPRQRLRRRAGAPRRTSTTRRSTAAGPRC